MCIHSSMPTSAPALLWTLTQLACYRLIHKNRFPIQKVNIMTGESYCETCRLHVFTCSSPTYTISSSSGDPEDVYLSAGLVILKSR